jgi:hypothetical protein
MNINPSYSNHFGLLFHINDITEEQIFICSVNDSNIGNTINEILRREKNDMASNTTVAEMSASSEVCGGMSSKEFISIPESLNYICFNKRLLEGKSPSYTFGSFKNLDVYGTEFSLRGYISHIGEIVYESGLPSARSGHYIYVSIENNRQVVYNDSQNPEFIDDNDNKYIRRGYIFLYKRVRGGGGAAVAKGGNITKKNNRSSIFNVNNKTRKTNNKNNKSPKNKNKNKTQHFKIVRNGNNTRKKAK